MILGTELGDLLYFVGNVMVLLGQLNGILFTILVVHPGNLHGFSKMWYSITKTSDNSNGTNGNTVISPAPFEMT
jgi:hypothetical protein